MYANFLYSSLFAPMYVKSQIEGVGDIQQSGSRGNLPKSFQGLPVSRESKAKCTFHLRCNIHGKLNSHGRGPHVKTQSTRATKSVQCNFHVKKLTYLH